MVFKMQRQISQDVFIFMIQNLMTVLVDALDDRPLYLMNIQLVIFVRMKPARLGEIVYFWRFECGTSDPSNMAYIMMMGATGRWIQTTLKNSWKSLDLLV